MKKSRYNERQIISVLKEVEEGRLSRKSAGNGISDVTYDNWQSKYGGIEAFDVRLLKDLEDETRRLKQMYADLSLDHKILKEIIAKKL